MQGRGNAFESGCSYSMFPLSGHDSAINSHIHHRWSCDWNMRYDGRQHPQTNYSKCIMLHCSWDYFNYVLACDFFVHLTIHFQCLFKHKTQTYSNNVVIILPSLQKYKFWNCHLVCNCIVLMPATFQIIRCMHAFEVSKLSLKNCRLCVAFTAQYCHLGDNSPLRITKH